MSLELIDVTKKVGVETHIYPTNLVLEPGNFNVLLGTTLAGKTTLMQLMAGLEAPTAGQLKFDGKDVTGVRVQKRNVSMVYQQFINYPNFSVYDNIASPLKVEGHSKIEIKKRVGQIAELLKLSPMLDRRPSQLSGGQQQRVAMARALVKDSDLILLDEPLANLDFKLREELRDELPKLFAERDCIVVYATTEPVEALLFGGHTACLNAGRVVQFGETANVYRAPQHLRAAQVFSEPPINLVKWTKKGNTIESDGATNWKLPAAYQKISDGEYTLGLRPHHLGLDRSASAAEDAEIEGKVLIKEISGSESVLQFEFDNNYWVALAHGVHDVDIGETVKFYADLSEAFLFDKNGTRVEV